VERSLDPSLMGIPAAVIQYNPNGNLADLPVEANRRMDTSDGSIIAVSYEVRACMRNRSGIVRVDALAHTLLPTTQNNRPAPAA
jgi:hypothetical protein